MLSKNGSSHITDEVYNTLIAGFGALLSLIGSLFLIFHQQKDASLLSLLSFATYGASLFMMFLSSALHHGINGSPKTNHYLRQLDYFTIFFLIAGTFTPICLMMPKPFGWIILGLIWGLAILGIILKAVFPHVPKWCTLSLYIAMGWIGILIVKPLYQIIQAQGLFALLLGGLFFTVGGIIYGSEKPNPFPGKFGFHEIWHCFVLAGAASHFYVIWSL